MCSILANNFSRLKSMIFKNIVCENRHGDCEFQTLVVNLRSFLYNLTQLTYKVELVYNVKKETEYYVSL